MSARCRAVCVLTFAVATAAPALGQSMHNLAALQQGAAASNAYQGSALWISWDQQGFTSRRYASAVRLTGDFILTAAHVVSTQGTVRENFVVGDGSNYWTNTGLTRSVSEWFIYPGWTGVGPGRGVDLAIGRLSSFLPGVDAVIGPAALGQTVSYVGFGRPASPGEGLLPLDGERRLFTTTISRFGTATIDPIYGGGTFFPGSPALDGLGTSGSSGSPGFANGLLTYLASTQVGSPGYFGSTYGVRLDLYQSWIAATIPTPGAASMLALAGLLAARRRR